MKIFYQIPCQADFWCYNFSQLKDMYLLSAQPGRRNLGWKLCRVDR